MGSAPECLSVNETNGNVYIRADGSVDPPTAPIWSVDNVVYTFTDNIYDEIVVERSNIIVNGGGHTLQGTGSGCGFNLTGVENVTIENTNVRGFYYGIYGSYSHDINIIHNNVTHNTDSGIYLLHSRNSIIERNDANNNGRQGIQLKEYSYNNTVSDNNSTNNVYAIYLSSSSYCLISKNNVANNKFGIHLSSSSYCSISGNNSTNNEYNIRLDYSSDNTLRDNNMTGDRYNFGVLGTSLQQYIHNIDTSNTVNGKPVYYMINQNNLTVDSSTYPSIGYLAVVNSTNIIVKGFSVSKNRQGVLFAYTANSRIQNVTAQSNKFGISLYYCLYSVVSCNEATYNMEHGVMLSNSYNCYVFSNELANNTDGIYMAYSINGIVSGNKAIDNDCGLRLDHSSNNTMYHNNFIDNNQQVYIETSGYANFWDNGVEGNYWSNYPGVDSNHDGVGGTPYIIDANNTDSYPLMGIFSNFNTSLGYHVNVVSNSTIEDFEYFESNSMIRVRVLNMIANQTFGFFRVCIPHALMDDPDVVRVVIDGGQTEVLFEHFTLYDNTTHRWIYFAYEHSTREVIIQSDTTPPTISILSPENKTYTLNDIPLTFTVSEFASWTGYSLDGQANVTISGNTTIVSLPDGLHTVTVYVNDTAGNMHYSDTVYFTISIDTIPPTISILSPENKTYSTTDIPLTFTVNESVFWMAYSLDNKANMTVTGNTTLSGLFKGAHSIIVYASDTDGNTGASEMIGFTIEPQQKEAFPTWIVATIVIIVVVGATLSVYFAKVKKTTEKIR